MIIYVNFLVNVSKVLLVFCLDMSIKSTGSSVILIAGKTTYGNFVIELGVLIVSVVFCVLVSLLRDFLLL